MVRSTSRSRDSPSAVGRGRGRAAVLLRPRLTLFGAWAALFAALFVLAHRFDSGAVSPHRLFHPEALYPAALLEDLGNWATWNVPFSPYFVPDLPLFFIARALTDEVATAVYLFAALQVVLLVIGHGWLFGLVLGGDRPLRRRVRSLTVLAAVLVTLACGWNASGGGELQQVFVAAFHTGSFVLAPFCYGLSLRALNRRSAAALDLPVLFLVCFLGAFSDALFMTVFALPAVAALLLLGRAGFVAGRWWQTAAVVVSSSGLGILAVPGFNALGTLHVQRLRVLSPSQIADALGTLFEYHDDFGGFAIDSFFGELGFLYRGYWLLWLVVTAVLALIGWQTVARRAPLRALAERSRLAPAPRRNLGFLAAATVAGVVATTAATAWIGLTRSAESGSPAVFFINRYLISLYVFPILAAALYLPALLGEKRAFRLEVPALLLAWVLCLFQAARTDLGAPLARYRPPGIDCLDGVASDRGLREGLAYFHSARRFELFSRAGLRIDQVTSDFEPIEWIASRTRHGTKGYDFVIASRLRDPRDVVAALGEPSEEMECDGLRLLLYDEPRPFPRPLPTPSSGPVPASADR